jgi:hypothetical protein
MPISSVFRIGAVFCFLDLACHCNEPVKLLCEKLIIFTSQVSNNIESFSCSEPTCSAFFHEEEIQIKAEAHVLACVASSMISLFFNMHKVVQYNAQCLYMKVCEPKLLNLYS